MATLLERQLSLSEGGGIRDIGQRVKILEDEAYLFVGLGGTGADALLHVKNEVMSRIILPTDAAGVPTAEDPAEIGFLEIDTDTTTKEKTYGSAHFDESRGEFCDISVTDLPGVISEVIVQKRFGADCWQWAENGILSSAGNIRPARQVSRLCLAWNIDRAVNSVREKIRQLTLHCRTYTLTIFLFSGISGVTGSGILLDMAYLLRKIGHCIVPDVQVLGYLMTPDVNPGGGESEAMRANGFACLKELD